MKTCNPSGEAALKEEHHQPQDHGVPGSDAGATDPTATKINGRPSEGEPKLPTPAEVFGSPALGTRGPRDSREARIRNKDPHNIAREEQNDYIAETLRNGTYIRDQEAFVEENNRRFPMFAMGLGEPLFTPVLTRMSRILASMDGPETTIFGEDGFAVDYLFPETGESLLGDYYPCVLDHFYFTAVMVAWQMDSYYAQIGIGSNRFLRILSHPAMGFITPSGDDCGWRPGPANRRKMDDGEIVGSVDYVITAKDNLYLTPHGLLVIHERLLRLAQMIF